MVSNIEAVKKALGISGNALDDTITPYIEDVENFVIGAGVPASEITPGMVARGLTDIWNYGSGDGEFSESFMYMVSQRRW